jgi:hypothetical protein
MAIRLTANSVPIDLQGYLHPSDAANGWLIWAPNGGEYVCPPQSKADQFRARVRQNLAGASIPSKYLNIIRDNDPEGRARALLRELVGEDEYRRYVTKGFTVVRGKTGLVYKIAYGQPIKCYAPGTNGKYVQYQSLCVVFKDHGMPPTDQVIMQRLLVKNDEFGLRSVANISKLCDDSAVRLGDAADMIRKAMSSRIREVISHAPGIAGGRIVAGATA